MATTGKRTKIVILAADEKKSGKKVSIKESKVFLSDFKEGETRCGI